MYFLIYALFYFYHMYLFKLLFIFIFMYLFPHLFIYTFLCPYNEEDVFCLRHSNRYIYIYIFFFSLKQKVFIGDCIKSWNMFVCLWFCAFTRTKRFIVCEDCTLCTDNSDNKHSPWFQKQHVPAIDCLLFNTHQLISYRTEIFLSFRCATARCCKNWWGHGDTSHLQIMPIQ